MLATGDGRDAAMIGDYKTDLTVSLKGAIVKGEFDRYTVATWLNYELSLRVMDISSHCLTLRQTL